MSEIDDERPQNLKLIADSPPTQPEGHSQTRTQHEVALNYLTMMDEEEDLPRLCAFFGVATADELAEKDQNEFYRLLKLESEERAKVIDSKPSEPLPIAAASTGNATIATRIRCLNGA